MNIFTRGQKSKLVDIGCGNIFDLDISACLPGSDVDIACFGLDANDKLSDDRYMVFYNQLSSPAGAVTLAIGQTSVFSIDLNKLPATINKLVFTAAVDAPKTMKSLTFGEVRIGNISFPFKGSDFDKEKAIIVAEIYKRDDVWRFAAVCAGYNDGLDALVKHFGGELASENVSPELSPVSLLKKVEAKAPGLVSLVKQASISLDKVGLSNHKARVCLVLDISGSMSRLYKEGLVQKFSERILALGCKFDDDMEIDVFLFGRDVHKPEPMNLSNLSGYIDRLIKRFPLEGDTRYGEAISAVRKFYFPDAAGLERKAIFKDKLPVFVMFCTDGTTSDKPKCEKQLRWASREPIFFQFLGIGKVRKSKLNKMLMPDSDFPFLEALDELDGRLIDNANFFSVSSPNEHSDDVLYSLLMTEYPDWLNKAKAAGLL
jgi:stress response protein SCP2